jgi:hypothetical protein
MTQKGKTGNGNTKREWSRKGKGRQMRKETSSTHEIQKVRRVEDEKGCCDGACNGEYESVFTPCGVFHFGDGDGGSIRGRAVCAVCYCGWAEFCGGRRGEYMLLDREANM